MTEKTHEEELLDELQKEEKEFREQREAMQALLACGGWNKLVEIMEKHIRQREIQAVYNTEREIEESGITRERLSGQCEGILLFLKLPKLIVDQPAQVDDNDPEE